MTSSRWKPAQRVVLVSVPTRPLQCIAGVAVTRNDLPVLDEGREKDDDSHQLGESDIGSRVRSIQGR